jgi:transcription-repair coupling factor (superfamily II helicase)
MATTEVSVFSPPLPNQTTKPLFWTGLSGCADTLALANAIKNEARLFVIVTPDSQTALRLEQELKFFLEKAYPILHFPDWETLPYDVFSPLPEIISERLKTLAALPQTKRGALVVSIATLMHRLAPREHVLAHSFSLTVGGTLNLDLTRAKLESVGYQCVSQVYQHGEFAVRGAIVDLFPMGSDVPYRIELFDDEIESIRTFDPETQMSLEKVREIQLFPAREFPFTDASIKQFRQAFREQFPQASAKNNLYVDVSKGIAFGGIEYYFPLFVETTESLFDYLPASSVLVLPENFNQGAELFYTESEERF